MSLTNRKLFKLTKTFGGGTSGEAKPQPLAVAEEGKAKVTAFQSYTPLINAVCNQGLRERHWTAIAEVVGFEIKQDEVSWWLWLSCCNHRLPVSFDTMMLPRIITSVCWRSRHTWKLVMDELGN